MILTNNAAAIQVLIILTILASGGTAVVVFFGLKKWIAVRVIVRILHPDRRETRHIVRPEPDGMIIVDKYKARYMYNSGDVYYTRFPIIGDPIPTITVHISKPEALDLNSLVPKSELTPQELSTAFDNRMLEQWARATSEPGIKKVLQYIIIATGLLFITTAGGFYFLVTQILTVAAK